MVHDQIKLLQLFYITQFLLKINPDNTYEQCRPRLIFLTMCAVVSNSLGLAETLVQFFLQSRDRQVIKAGRHDEDMFINHNVGVDIANQMFLNVTGDVKETLDFNS